MQQIFFQKVVFGPPLRRIAMYDLKIKGGGGGGAVTPPLDPPLRFLHIKIWFVASTGDKGHIHEACQLPLNNAP